ncbi:MAG: zinc-binding dehydrogenase [Proteobacteria bacterium]|nr:zinc-binding dehydrogenase [Pseudomonadota bacterium]
MTLAEQAIHLKRLHRRSRRGRKSGQRRRRDLPPLILMTDEVRLANPEAAVGALPRGSAVIFRHYRADDRRAIATRLAGICRRRGLKLLIAGDVRLAIEVGAQGLHLPEYLARRLACHRWGRRGSRPGWLITVAAHSLPALQRARRLGADHAFLADDDPGGRLRRLGGADACLNFAPSAAVWAPITEAINPRGWIISVAMVAEPVSLSLEWLTFNGVRITGTAVGGRQELQDVLALAARHPLQVDIEAVSLDQADVALDRLAAGRVAGRSVIDFSRA